MKSVTLTSDWGRAKAGTEFRVLIPGEPIKGACVDPQRAAQLVRDGFAIDTAHAAPAEPAKNKKKAVKRGN